MTRVSGPGRLRHDDILERHKMQLQNFRARQATGVVLTNDNLDAKPLLERKEDAVSDFAVNLTADKATCVIPPHAVVFVTLTQL